MHAALLLHSHALHAIPRPDRRSPQVYSCLDKVHKVEWSPNSRYVLCGLYDRATAQVWSVEDPEWACKIDEGPAGMTNCRWCAVVYCSVSHPQAAFTRA